MSAIVRIEKAYNCLENFKNNCKNDEYKKLIDIFSPMFYQENKHRLEISVGKKLSEFHFRPILSSVTNNFIISLSKWKNEPQFVIKDIVEHNVITLINLALINNLRIESKKYEDINFYEHNIYFNYNNEIDYHIHIEITE